MGDPMYEAVKDFARRLFETHAEFLNTYANKDVARDLFNNICACQKEEEWLQLSKEALERYIDEAKWEDEKADWDIHEKELELENAIAALSAKCMHRGEEVRAIVLEAERALVDIPQVRQYLEGIPAGELHKKTVQALEAKIENLQTHLDEWMDFRVELARKCYERAIQHVGQFMDQHADEKMDIKDMEIDKLKKLQNHATDFLQRIESLEMDVEKCVERFAEIELRQSNREAEMQREFDSKLEALRARHREELADQFKAIQQNAQHLATIRMLRNDISDHQDAAAKKEIDHARLLHKLQEELNSESQQLRETRQNLKQSEKVILDYRERVAGQIKSYRTLEGKLGAAWTDNEKTKHHLELAAKLALKHGKSELGLKILLKGSVKSRILLNSKMALAHAEARTAFDTLCVVLSPTMSATMIERVDWESMLQIHKDVDKLTIPGPLASSVIYPPLSLPGIPAQSAANPVLLWLLAHTAPGDFLPANHPDPIKLDLFSSTNQHLRVRSLPLLWATAEALLEHLMDTTQPSALTCILLLYIVGYIEVSLRMWPSQRSKFDCETLLHVYKAIGLGGSRIASALEDFLWLLLAGNTQNDSWAIRAWDTTNTWDIKLDECHKLGYADSTTSDGVLIVQDIEGLCLIITGHHTADEQIYVVYTTDVELKILGKEPVLRFRSLAHIPPQRVAVANPDQISIMRDWYRTARRSAQAKLTIGDVGAT